MSDSKKKEEDKSGHSHAGCSHDHNHDHHDHDKKEEKKDSKEEEKIDPKELISNKEKEIEETLTNINNGLKSMGKKTENNILLVEKEFKDLLQKLEIRRDTLIKELKEIEIDKKEILNNQIKDLKSFSNILTNEKQKKDASNIDIKMIENKNILPITSSEIILKINNNKLTNQINVMGDLNNTFSPIAPNVQITEVKAHTCKVLFSPNIGKYGGYQKPNKYLIQIAFGPKNKNQTNDDEKIDYNKLKWKQIAERENALFIRVKKLKPSTIYYVRVKCKNEYGWSEYCKPVKFKTYILKINTKIMTSDEIQILIDLIKQKRKKKSLEWNLLFRGSNDGFLASTFHLKCDDMANTICVIESNHGNVFGGFTTLPWKSDVGRYHVDEEAFVFIVRKKKKSLKKAIMYLQYTSSQHSVVHNKYMGPVFGYG
eukprot:198880_1